MANWIPISISAATGLLVVLHLVAEARQARAWRAITKTLASVGMIALGMAAGATGSAYGGLILLGLILSLWGDVFLLSSARGWFLAGLVSFLLAHVAYCAAFVQLGAQPRWAGIAFGGLFLVGIGVYRWLRPGLGKMKVPVVFYILVISAMVALAIGTAPRFRNWFLLGGAIGFYLSDLAVARNRFVAPGIINRVWGLPLYYGAQLALAWSVSVAANG